MLPLQVISKILSKVQLDSAPASNKAYLLIVNDMMDSIGESLGVNTLKRLFGSLNENVTPAKNTLNVIARYLDYPDWDTCEVAMREGVIRVVDEDKSDDGYSEYLEVKYLSCGDRVEFRYAPDNKLLLEYLFDQRFKVIFSTRPELQPMDTMVINYFQEGCFVVAFDVVRAGQKLPSPIKSACSGGGISYLKCIRKE
jgi:hypothetical protein